MDERFTAYAAARQALTDAEQAAADARRDFAAAEAACRAEVDAAWSANLSAVQTAKAAVQAAKRAKATVEAEVGDAARSRDPVRPVLNVDEHARLQAAVAEVTAATEALGAAEATFKAGVTAEQLTGS